MIKDTKISIIVPTKNSEKTLDSCLMSIKTQSYKNYQIIVVDNSSTDKTLKIAKKYTKKVFIKGPERSAQRNFGAKKAKGDYVFFVDSDMKLTKHVLKQCVDILAKGKYIKGIIIPEESFGKGFWANAKKLERSFYVGVDFMEASRFFERKAFLSAGGFDESMISGEDWHMSQIISKEGSIERIHAKILHNEGDLTLRKTVSKKFYYAKHFSRYVDLNENEHIKGQISIFRRYALFFSKPGMLLKDPILGIGMLFMKTCEFGAGAIGYAYSILINKA